MEERHGACAGGSGERRRAGVLGCEDGARGCHVSISERLIDEDARRVDDDDLARTAGRRPADAIQAVEGSVGAHHGRMPRTLLPRDAVQTVGTL